MENESKLESIKLTTEEGAVVRELEKEMLKCKFLVADLYKRHLVLEENLKKATFDLDQVEQRRIAKATEILKSHGIDVTDPKQGNWALDVDTMSFSKLNS
jgi:hypothetical protein